eukprot:scaffold338_cov361-Pavlova_lutheri.AAC.13
MVPQGAEFRSPPLQMHFRTDAPHSIDLTQCSQREGGKQEEGRNYHARKDRNGEERGSAERKQT